MWRESQEAERPVAWVTLDDGDNDPVVLWSYVIEALRRVFPELRVTTSPARVGPSRLVDVVLPEFVNELSALGEAALVLDDFHRISNATARESVAWLIDNAPSTFQLVIATRSEPALPLAAWRAHGELLELRAEELGFTPAEANVLFNERLELGLDREYVDDLVERTEGWPAGVYLAALSLQAVEDRHAFVSTFSGRNRHVVDFLVDEVLEAHDPELQDLMLRSSIFERMCGPLCDAVLERDGAAELLGQLSRTNLFLLPLDDHGEWYRFHHLFAQLLRVELEHREPGLATTLHHRACAWYRDHGSVDEAMKHALEAGAFGEAAELIAGAWIHAVNAGRHATVQAWLRRFPADLLREDPLLLLVQAWMHSVFGDRDEAAAKIAALERIGNLDQGPLPDGSTSFAASLATLRAAYSWGDAGAGYDNALLATKLQRPESPFWTRVCWALAKCCYYRGRLDEADRLFGELAEVGPREERWVLAASAFAYRSLIAGDRGKVDEQFLLAEEAAGLTRDRGAQELLGEVRLATGASIAARAELNHALQHVTHGVAVLRPLGRPLDLANALIRRAAVLEGLGRRRAAAVAIREARAAVDSCPDPGVLRERIEALEQSAQARPRRQETKLTNRELVVLRMLKGPLSERDIGRELYLSHNTVHSHTRSIYRKLGVSSRAEALQRALALGLLKL
jgi:LuxR family maltose regulon positive regulatory protein